MTLDQDAIRGTIDDLMPSAIAFLERLISFPSTSGKEHEAICWAEGQFLQLGVEVTRASLANTIKQDKDYSSPVDDIDYDGRFNLRLRLPGSGGGRRLLLNSHVDVVPSSTGCLDAFVPKMRDGVVYGRGACDAKGQLATIYLVLAAIGTLGFRLDGDLIVHVVNEEENGGNGTLAMVRAGEAAEACIVMEPTGGKIFSSVRGAVWFRLVCEGTPGHSGWAGDTTSALSLAWRAMNLFDRYHDELLAASRDIPLFDKYENPMPLTFGRLTAGDWPATAPARAVVEGVLGFLPNRTRHEIMAEMQATLAADSRLAGRFHLGFTYRHDSHVLDPAHPLVQGLSCCCAEGGMAAEVDAMTASCDSWWYNNMLGIPTVVYGPGSLAHAHGSNEQIRLSEIADAGRVLTAFVMRWCGGT
ncbi:MAG TPA: M20/M25/M40 family metallo-hydrolase [Thermoguttaceae bacterium]|nr:M20/M25/M40 family metallo-hydrolase [Thermoguttaceae bacterium]